MFIGIMLLIPFILSILSLFIRKERVLGITNASGYGLLLGIAALFTKTFLANPQPLSLWGLLYIDALSIFFVLTTAVVAFAASVYSIAYMRDEIAENKITIRKAGGYFHLFNLFCFTMLLVPLLNNLALVWIAIEMTTLISAFLVGFHNVKESIEAAWKYIIICSVGITFALLGIIFFYYTSSTHAGIKSLEWVKMLEGAYLFEPNIIKIALLFIFVGYGTKAGFAPMHNWLPDAHSQALSPISGLLSGVLLKTSLYAILRFVMLANSSVGYAFSARLFIVFGVCSLAIAAGFILVQKDLKRLMAYHSVEHIGVISVGFGFGLAGGAFGGLLHIFNHAVTKALMFFCAGNAVRIYKTNNMSKMQGLMQAAPFTGVIMLFGALALGGMPPFSIFISEVLILIAGFSGKHYFISALMFLFLAIAFAGLVHHVTKIIFGNKPQNIARQKEPLSTKFALLFLGIFILGLGLKIPQSFLTLLLNCQKLVLGQ
ncbi:MAG: hydrogenase 4 subunit F [Candidatus Omnitrophica bacterium]|nr:hydrogenase 4 subunit F [Candidatus Omnitrophota bacterium]